VGAPCCMSGMLRIPGMSCMPPGCPGWGCIMAMFRQHGHMPPVDCPGCAGWVIWPGCWAWAVAVGVAHIIGLAAAVEPVVWAAAWCIGQARTGVAAKPAATAMARVNFLMARPSELTWRASRRLYAPATRNVVRGKPKGSWLVRSPPRD
jgi:hypothetical protein